MGNLPAKTLHGRAGETSPPAFPSSVAGYCGGRALPLICAAFPDHSSFSVLREIPMAFSCGNFKKLNCDIFYSVDRGR